MKSVRIIESCLALGQHAEAGTILRDIPDPVANDLIANGRAVVVQGESPLENREPELENRDPKPKRKYTLK